MKIARLYFLTNEFGLLCLDLYAKVIQVLLTQPSRNQFKKKNKNKETRLHIARVSCPYLK